MKIVILQDDYPPYHAGGAAVIAKNLAHIYAHVGHEVCVITTVQDTTAAGDETIDGVRIKRVYTAYPGRWRAYISLYNPQVIGKVRAEIETFRPDIVHAHNVHSYLSYHALKIASRSGARVFLTAHDTMLFDYGKSLTTEKVRAITSLRSYRFRFNPLRNWCIRYYMRYVTGLVAVSRALQEALINNGFKNVGVIHNGIDVNLWTKPDRIDEYKKELGIGEHAILFGGRLSGPKGARKLVEALSLIIKTIPDAQLLVIGKKDSYAEKMLAYAQELDVGKNVLFTGWLTGEQVRRAYYSAAVVAVPSLYVDPFPTMNLEAMACRKSVVATCLGGSREIVVDGETGYVVNPHTVQVMAEKLANLLTNKATCTQFGESGYTRVVKDFSLVEQAQKYEKLFTSTVH